MKIAWRNLWRNKLRTGVLLVSIILGLWGSMFFMGLMQGMNRVRISSSINTYLSHIQIHNKSYIEDPVLENFIDTPGAYTDFLLGQEQVKAFSPRLITDAMVSSSKGSFPIKLIGIDPTAEASLSEIKGKLQEGSYLNRYKKPTVVIGRALAEKLGVKLRSKVKFNFANLQGDILAYGFRVEGIYKINNLMIEKSYVYIAREKLAEILNTGEQINEIKILTRNIKKIDGFKKELEKINPRNSIRTWDEIDPELGYAQDMMMTFTLIFMSIVLIALAFGIINAMLMAVLERRRELGILMAIGLNKAKVFRMIVAETFFLILIATPAGMGLAYATIRYFGIHGLKFIGVEKGMEAWGIGRVIYTDMPAKYYWIITAMIVLTTFIAALFPARRALKTEILESIRDV